MNEARETELLLPITNQDIDSETTSASLQRKSGLTKLLGSVTQFFTSGRLLNVLSFVNGLRDPRNEGFWAAMFTTAMVVTDLVFLAMGLFLHFISSKIDCKSDWICPHRDNTTTHLSTETNQFVLLMGYLAGISSHFVFFLCLLKLGKGGNTIKLDRYVFRLNNRSFWLQTNVFLLLLGSGLISVIFLVNSGTYLVLGNIIGNISMWRSIVNCCLFGMIMMALNGCIERCENEIKNLHSGEVNDAIVIHQQLCARVFSTSDTLKTWFIINWLGVLLVGVFYVGNINTILHAYYVIYGNLWYICIFLFLFLYPCYSAASVTSKCRQILIDMNMTTPDDWPPGHPFKQRGQLLQFIQYAEYTQCGFRVGNTVFGTNYAWMSTLLALLTGVVKFLYN